MRRILSSLNVLLCLVAFSLIVGFAEPILRAQQDTAKKAEKKDNAREVSVLNRNNYPKLASCQSTQLDHPEAEAKANIARGDLRPFAVFGFTPGDIPGVFCPSGNYRTDGRDGIDSRGGTFVSDVPDACGSHSFSNAPRNRMEAYNRTLAADRRFQKITGCRPSTYCEEKYRKGFGDPKAADPKCPAEPRILYGVARQQPSTELVDVLKEFRSRTPRSRDAITDAFIGALQQAKWDNARLLLAAGADINGRAINAYPDNRKWLPSPLAAALDQNIDQKAKGPMVKWLLSKGADFSNPEAYKALNWAASENNVEAVAQLLARGADPNGGLPKKMQDIYAQAAIPSEAAYSYGPSPLYSAIYQAMLYRRSASNSAHEKLHRAEINVVVIYRAGGRFVANRAVSELREQPNLNIVSVLLAAAHREGRLRELIDYMMLSDSDGFSFSSYDREQRKALLWYLEQVKNCKDIRPVPEIDHVKLCTGGNV